MLCRIQNAVLKDSLIWFENIIVVSCHMRRTCLVCFKTGKLLNWTICRICQFLHIYIFTHRKSARFTHPVAGWSNPQHHSFSIPLTIWSTNGWKTNDVKSCDNGPNLPCTVYYVPVSNTVLAYQPHHLPIHWRNVSKFLACQSFRRPILHSLCLVIPVAMISFPLQSHVVHVPKFEFVDNYYFWKKKKKKTEWEEMKRDKIRWRGLRVARPGRILFHRC